MLAVGTLSLSHDAYKDTAIQINSCLIPRTCVTVFAMSRFGGTLINRDYTRLWWGQAVSTVGDFVFDTTLVLWIATKLGKGQSWAPAAVGGVMLAASVAILVV